MCTGRNTTTRTPRTRALRSSSSPSRETAPWAPSSWAGRANTPGSWTCPSGARRSWPNRVDTHRKRQANAPVFFSAGGRTYRYVWQHRCCSGTFDLLEPLGGVVRGGIFDLSGFCEPLGCMCLYSGVCIFGAFWHFSPWVWNLCVGVCTPDCEISEFLIQGPKLWCLWAALRMGLSKGVNYELLGDLCTGCRFSICLGTLSKGCMMFLSY